MSYAAAIDQLSAMTPELFTQPGHTRRKFSLDEIGILLAAMGNPHHRFPSVLIAGTNGKGSTAATLASILTASGLCAGLYTSPHLTRPNERIRVNGVEITDDAFASLYFRVHDCGQQLVLDQTLAQLPSFFETLTAMAFLHFAESAPHTCVDIAILEVGMGGRLDATNIVDPILSIVTDISLDHTEWLGPTIAAIAREKAGILRSNGTLITLPQHPEANEVLGEIATELGVRAINAVPYMPPAQPASGAARTVAEAVPPSSYLVQALGAAIEVASPLHGAHQHRRRRARLPPRRSHHTNFPRCWHSQHMLARPPRTDRHARFRRVRPHAVGPRCGAQSRRCLGPARRSAPALGPRRTQRETSHAHIRLPARQTHRRNGPNPLPNLRSRHLRANP
jgi:dihydrofolate synthase/folylpolyglutamate synthase